MLNQTIHSGNTDRGQQAADGRWNQTDQQRYENENRLRGAGINGERLESHDRQQKYDRQAREQNIQRYLVWSFLSFSAFNQRNHPIDECLTGIRGDADFDLI